MTDEHKSLGRRLYRTSDLYWASYLCCLDFPLQTTETEKARDGGKKVVFVFSMPEEVLPRVKASYFGGSGTVHARKYVDNLRSLKSMMFT